MITRVLTSNHEEWLALRNKTIGGSDASAIIGLSRFASPFSVWAEKTGRVPPKEETEALRQGRDLEAYVAERFCEVTGLKVRRVNATLFNSKYPFAHANVDREVLGAGVRACLECKTTSSLNLKRFKDTEFPVEYYAQCVHYLLVGEYKRVYLAVLVLGRGFFTFTLERDEDEIRALKEAESAFYYNNLLADEPPPVDGLDATTDTISAVYDEEGESDIDVDLTPLECDIREIWRLGEEIKELTDLKAERINRVKQYMQTAGRGNVGEWSVSWKGHTRTTLDVERLKAAYPDIDFSQFEKVTKARPFKLSRNELP